MRSDFISAIISNQSAFSFRLSPETVEHLADHYEIVQEHNSLLHLVAPCSAAEFAIRHVLESLLLLNYLDQDMHFADVGTGAGLPSIPCLIVRPDLAATLIESKVKKAVFLEEAIRELGLAKRAVVINKQFEEVGDMDFTVVTCRALDKFTDKLPRLLKWSGKRKKVFFGGLSLREALERQKLRFDEKLIPLSEQRLIFSMS
jgi:16S rRNA (guanine527-N7)-methyltransferase